MILTIFRPKRTKNGKVHIARSYRGRYRLDGEKKITDIPLHTIDRRVAQQRIKQIVKPTFTLTRDSFPPWPVHYLREI